ncbi:MAG: hypothetical protein Q9M91_05480 [Candidatus Dojkabacteria bacterium]|nr:hypothetical protein [Candidatus Dojkabacteria bacterium]MDQ7021254.1 hypothetical protein [Candidatus Dojkabacteria bacterium]
MDNHNENLEINIEYLEGFQSDVNRLHEKRREAFEVVVQDAKSSKSKTTEFSIYEILYYTKIETREVASINGALKIIDPMIWMGPARVELSRFLEFTEQFTVGLELGMDDFYKYIEVSDGFTWKIVNIFLEKIIELTPESAAGGFNGPRKRCPASIAPQVLKTIFI